MSACILFEAFGVTSIVQFDATLVENHSSSAKATEHPVEEGAALTDHVRPDLDRVSVTGIITNTPTNDTSISRVAGARVVAGMVGGPTYLRLAFNTSKQTRAASLVGGFISPLNINGFGRPAKRAEFVPGTRGTFPADVVGSAMQFPVRKDRPKEVYNVLQFLCSSGIEVKLLTELREYPTMVIEQLRAPVTIEDAIQFSLELKQIRFATTKRTKIVPTKRLTAETRGQTLVDEGPSAGFAPPEEIDLDSHLKDIFRGQSTRPVE